MSAERRIIFGAYYLFPSAHYSEAWRHPYSETDYVSPRVYERLARSLEDIGYDLAFIPESLAPPRGDDDTWQRGIETGAIGSIRHEGSVLAQLITQATRHLHVGVTLSTTFWQPYQIARLFASLNHFSAGRVAWNIITSAGDDNARSFGRTELPEHDARYEHAERVVQATNELWKSWDAESLIVDKDAGVFADPSGVHEVHYAEEDVRVDSVLTLPTPPGGRPTLIQAGESASGRELAAKWADLVFSIQNTPENLASLRNDVRARAARHGRNEDEVRLLAAVIPVLGEDDGIAAARSQYLTSLINPADASKRLARQIGLEPGIDVASRAIDLVDGDAQRLPLRTRRVWEELGEDATFGELAVQVSRSSSTAWIVGSPRTVADRLEEFFSADAADGFIVTPTHFPGSFEEFGRSVIPLLRARGLARAAHEPFALR